LHLRVPRVRGRAIVFHGCAGHARFPLRLRRRPAFTRRRRRDVGAPGFDPDRDRPDAHGPDAGAAVVSGARRVLTEVASVTLGVALVIWSLTPVYNMLLIALDRDEGDIGFA